MRPVTERPVRAAAAAIPAPPAGPAAVRRGLAAAAGIRRTLRSPTAAGPPCSCRPASCSGSRCWPYWPSSTTRRPCSVPTGWRTLPGTTLHYRGPRAHSGAVLVPRRSASARRGPRCAAAHRSTLAGASSDSASPELLMLRRSVWLRSARPTCQAAGCGDRVLAQQRHVVHAPQDARSAVFATISSCSSSRSKVTAGGLRGRVRGQSSRSRRDGCSEGRRRARRPELTAPEQSLRPSSGAVPAIRHLMLLPGRRVIGQLSAPVSWPGRARPEHGSHLPGLAAA
jgi:hypothetical protein